MCFVDIPNCTCVRETQRALLVENVDGEQAWFPKTTLGPGNELTAVDAYGVLSVAEWIAVERGFVEPPDTPDDHGYYDDECPF